jgi:hypothetical protein
MKRLLTNLEEAKAPKVVKGSTITAGQRPAVLDDVNTVIVPSGPHAGTYYGPVQKGNNFKTGAESRLFEQAGRLWLQADGTIDYD